MPLTARITLVRLARGKCAQCGKRRIRFTFALSRPGSVVDDVAVSEGLCAICIGVREVGAAKAAKAAPRPLPGQLGAFDAPPEPAPEPTPIPFVSPLRAAPPEG